MKSINNKRVDRGNIYDIVFVVDGGIGGGGAERAASRMINYWMEEGRKILLITVHSRKHDAYYINPKVERVIVTPIRNTTNSFHKIVEHLLYIFRLRNAIRLTKSRVVLSFVIFSNIRTILSCLGLKKTVVISERSATIGRSYGLFWDFLRFALYRFSNTVTGNSKHSLMGMRKYVSEDKLVYVPNFVDHNANMQENKKNNSIITVGRVIESKAQYLGIEAFALIGNTFCDWFLDIIGEGDQLEKNIKLSSKLNITNQVNFHGFVKNVNKYYKAASIFMLTSKYEGTPNSLLEAMSYGIPCIVPDNLLFIDELIVDGHNGLLYKHDDKYDLAKKITLLINDRILRKKISFNASTKVLEFSPDSVMEKWASVLKI